MEISATILALVPILIALIEVLKIAGLPSRYAPLFSLVLGVTGAAAVTMSVSPTTIVSGLVVGLSASGLYAGTKATIQ